MPTELTPSQERAATTFDRHLVVTAGAGAGKTRVLITRVMGLLEQGLAELDQVVALTFTNKAALEMKERLRQALEEAAAAASGEQAVLWERRKRDLEQARITTIHSFCTQLLREYPVEAEVDPQFSVLEEMEAALWLHEALDQSLLSLAEQGDEGVGQLLSLYARGTLLRELSGVYGRLREHGLEPDEAVAATARSLEESRRFLPDLARAITAGVTGLLAGLKARAGDGKGKTHARAAEQAVELQTRWDRAALALERLLAAAAEDRDPGPEDLALLEWLEPLSKVVSRNTRSLLAEIEALAEPLETFQDVVWGLSVTPASLAAGRLLQSAHGLYRERKLRAGALDFSDLQILARDLLRREEVASDLRQRLPFLMVDEYQDTNPLQSEIIGLWQPVNLFLVGDPKQSIYRFRGAEVELFRRARREIPEAGGEEVLLAENFRSRQGLIHFSNYLFRALMQEDYDEAVPGRQDEAEGGGQGQTLPPVEVLLPRALKDGEAGRDSGSSRQDDVALEAEAVAAYVHRLVDEGIFRVEDHPVRYGDFAVLMRATTDMGRYEQALRARGIPYYVVSGRGFYSKQEVRDCLNLLRGLENPADEISLVGALRSPFFGLSDETLFLLRRQEGLASWLDRLAAPPTGLEPVQAGLVQRASRLLSRFRLLQSRLPLPDLLEAVLEETGYSLVALGGHDGEQVIANLRKLVALARRLGQGTAGLREFIALVEEFEDREAREGEAAIQSGQGDTVKLMSVHQSKGLEFPVVVVADLARTQQALRGMLYRPELGLGLSAVGPDGERRTTWLRRRLEEEERRLERQESMRVLYVATTRARDRLVLAGTKSRINTARDYLEMASWLEWLCRALGITDTDELQAARAEGVPAYRPFGAPPDTTPGLARVRLWLPDDIAGLLAAEAQGGTKAPAGSTPIPEPPPDLLEAAGFLPDRGRRTGAGSQPGAGVGGVGPESPVSWSVTDLMTYQGCPRRFGLERRFGLPTDRPAGRGQGQFPEARGLDAITRGNLVHRVAERLRHPDQLDDLLAQVLREAGLTEEARARAAEKEVRPLLERYLRSEVFAVIASGLSRAEQAFQYRLPGTLLSVGGVMDNLVTAADGRHLVIDFKTNAIGPDEVEETAGKYRIQMETYALVAHRLLRLPVEACWLYFLQPDVCLRIPVAGDDLDGIEIRLKDLVATMTEGRSLTDYPPQVGNHCLTCPQRDFCRASGALAGHGEVS